MSDLLRIAVPNKGALSEAASSLLAEAGYRQRTDHKDLTLVDEENGVEFFYLRPRDIAVYVGRDLDIGITGRDLLLDSNADATEIKGLGFGHSRFRFAAPKSPQNTIEGLAGKRIATSYPGLLSAFLTERGIDAHLIHLDGAVESSIRLGVADAIADVVETGTTLRRLASRFLVTSFWSLRLCWFNVETSLVVRRLITLCVVLTACRSLVPTSWSTTMFPLKLLMPLPP